MFLAIITQMSAFSRAPRDSAVNHVPNKGLYLCMCSPRLKSEIIGVSISVSNQKSIGNVDMYAGLCTKGLRLYLCNNFGQLMNQG